MKALKILNMALDIIKSYAKINLALNITGKNINHTIINTLRRMGTFSVPIYAFTKIIINISQ